MLLIKYIANIVLIEFWATTFYQQTHPLVGLFIITQYQFLKKMSHKEIAVSETEKQLLVNLYVIICL